MAIVYVPTPLRRLTGGQARVEVQASTIRDLVEALEAQYPGVKARLVDEDRGEIKRFINVFVNGEEIRALQGEDTPLGENDEVSIIPAMAGGQ
nr:ubiquitin-like small modifier protein 1 [Ardenticatena sp.]